MSIAGALQGSLIERDKEIKTLVIKMIPGKRPEVLFSGFWNGRILRAAISSISKAYRTRNCTMVTKQKQGGQGDEKE